MPAYQFQVPGLGVVTAGADTEACARHQVGESLGINPDHLALVEKDPGAPVFEGDPTEPSSIAKLLGDVNEGDGPYCDCSECIPELVRLEPWQAVAGGLALGAALFLAIWRR